MEEICPESCDEIWLEHDHARLFATASGSDRGHPIVLLHGGLANHAACRRFAAPLAAHGRLVTPDLRASGRSHYAGELGWDQLADDVAALARHLALRDAVIGGISFGAGVAVRVALRHPALVAALVLLTPAYAGAEVGLTAAQRAAMDAMDAAGSRAPREGIAALFPLLDTLPPALRERARQAVATYDPASVATSTRFMASGAQPFASARELAAITAPALLVPGADPTHPPQVAALYAQHLPRCTTRAVDPPAYAAAIADFIARELA